MDKEYLVKIGVRAAVLFILTLFVINFVAGVGNANTPSNVDTLFNKSDCQTTLPYGFNDNGNGRAIWTYGEMTSGKGDFAKVHRLYCYYENKITGGKATCELHNFELSEERVKEIFTRGTKIELRSVNPGWMNAWSKTLENTDDRFVLLGGRPKLEETPKQEETPEYNEIIGSIRYHKSVITIRVMSYGSEDIVKSVFYALERHAKKVIDEKESNKLELFYEPPFPYLEKESSIRDPKSIKAGEFRAILKDENNKGIEGEIIHFYVETETSLHGTLAEMFATGRQDQPWRDIYPFLENADYISYIGYAVTDSEGIARLNYILRGSLRSDILAKKLVENGGKVQGNVRAVVLNRIAVKTWEVEHEASVPVKFEYLAKIVDIWGNGVPDSLPSDKLQGVISGPEQVRVIRSLVKPNLDIDSSVDKGFELMPGDIINIDGDTGIEVVWVNGDRIRLIVPEYVDVKEKQLVCSVNMLLCSDAYNSEFYTDYDELSKAFAGVLIEDGTKTLIETGKGFVPGAQTVSKGYSYVVNIIKKSDEQYGKIDLSKFSIITKIRVRSKIVIDATGDDTNIYIIEGSPDVLTVKDEEITLTSGQMVSISKDGSLSEVQSFDTETVLNEFYETALSATDVQGLTFESRSKPSGSSVQIPLTLSGIEEKIGNMDMTLSYDPSVLEATEAIKGGLTRDSLFDYNIPDEGTIKISLADSEGFSGEGSIAYVNFNVIGVEGSSSPLQITAMMANKANDYEELDIQTNDGEFRVISIEEGMGDGDGDGKYTALDALYALQMAVEKIPQDPVMDINGDGSVTSLDARGILKNAVGEE